MVASADLLDLWQPVGGAAALAKRPWTTVPVLLRSAARPSSSGASRANCGDLGTRSRGAEPACQRGRRPPLDIADEATHADLAVAYREMGLFGDAIRETLFVARGNAERPWHQALVILLAAEIAPDELFDTLNAVLCRR